MKTTLWLTLLVSITVLADSKASSQIVWEKTSIQKAADLTTDKVYFEFPFKNAGTTSVTITKITPLWNCTTAHITPSVYPPGAKGILRAEFTVGNRVGIQDKFIDVTTSDLPTKPIRLSFRVVLPEMASLIPNHLVWKLNGPSSEMVMTFSSEQAHPLHILEVSSSSKEFKCTLYTVRKGFDYQVRVTPLHLFAPFKSNIVIRTDYPPTKPREFEGLAEILVH